MRQSLVARSTNSLKEASQLHGDACCSSVRGHKEFALLMWWQVVWACSRLSAECGRLNVSTFYLKAGSLIHCTKKKRSFLGTT